MGKSRKESHDKSFRSKNNFGQDIYAFGTSIYTPVKWAHSFFTIESLKGLKHI